jgi:3-oxoacyl-[acyl-carrier protein] reductase
MEKKVAIITGSATGIGKAVAAGLARQGIHIVVNYSRSSAEAMQTAEEIRALGVSCLVEKADISDDDQVRRMVQNTVCRFGRLDYLVNSAGTTDYVPMNDLEGLLTEHWDRVMALNVKGLFFACRTAAPFLKQTKGSIVNITSAGGITGIGSSIAYAASKAAAISVTKSLARVLAPDVRVNSVAPGVVLSRWVEGRDEHIRKGLEGTLLGRLCEPQDVAEVVIPLLLWEGMVTGQTLIVDGGKII